MAAASAPLPFSKISIAGPTLSSLLRLSSSASAAGGLLFGHVAALPPPEPTDLDDPTPSLSSSSFSLTITSFLSSLSPLPFFDPLGRVDPTSPLSQNPNPNSSSLVVGWFSSRPRSPLRPSMRELAVSHRVAHTLNLNPTKACVFILLCSFSTANQAVHTHEYRAFVLSGSSSSSTVALRPVSVDVINVGPKFRGQYGAFSPESSMGLFPMVACRARVLEEGEGYMEMESGRDCENGEGGMMDCAVEGFGTERLDGLVGERTAEYSRELEELYGKMVGKLEGLVRLVEVSSAKVREQETQNSELRRKKAGLQ